MSYFRNIENDGVWVRGATHTFEFYYEQTLTPTGGALPVQIYADGSLGSIVYNRDVGGDWKYRVAFPSLAAANSCSSVAVLGARELGSSYFTLTDVADMFESAWATWTTGAPSLAEREIYSYNYTKWTTVAVSIPADATPGTYGILYLRNEYSAFDQINISPYFTAGPTEDDREILEITITASGGAGLPGAGIGEVSQDDATPTGFQPPRPDEVDPVEVGRPDTYNADWVWIENAWAEIAGVDAFAGGGRWNTQLFFVGKGVIYFEELS